MSQEESERTKIRKAASCVTTESLASVLLSPYVPVLKELVSFEKQMPC